MESSFPAHRMTFVILREREGGRGRGEEREGGREEGGRGREGREGEGGRGE